MKKCKSREHAYSLQRGLLGPKRRKGNVSTGKSEQRLGKQGLDPQGPDWVKAGADWS